jgi:hypothetical protein
VDDEREPRAPSERATEADKPSARPPLEADPHLEHIGRYRVRRVIGRGGMGVVYEAFDPTLGRSVALKVLSPEAERGGDAVERRARLVREAHAMARISHPNVVKVFDVGEHDGRVFVAMALIDGENLRSFAERRSLDWRAAVELMRGVGRGLAAAHRQGLLHRDVKPENVLVDRGGRPVLVDFGLVRAVSTPDANGPHWTTLTRTGMLLGTPGYMPSEQLGGGSIDARSDQYSFAVTLYELLYRMRPFRGVTLEAEVDAILAGDVQFPSRPAVPGRVKRVLARALSRRRDARYPSMDALVDDLGRAPRWIAAASLGAIALVASAIVAAVAWPRPERDEPPRVEPVPIEPVPVMVPSLRDAGADGGAHDAGLDGGRRARARDAGSRERAPQTLAEYDAYVEQVLAATSRACAGEASTPNPTGRVGLYFIIRGDGAVDGWRTPATGSSDEGWKSCVIRRVRGHRFTATPGGFAVAIDEIVYAPGSG